MKINNVDIQAQLVSGVNIKTLNNSSILGAGNLITPNIVHSAVGDGSAVTGTTSITASRIVTIQANTLTSACVLEIFVRSLRTGTVGTSTLYIYANTSASLTGATLMASSTSTNTRITQSIIRTMRLYLNSLTTMPNSSYSDYNADTTQSNFSFNIANTNYIIFAIANTSTSDSNRIVTSKIIQTNDYN
jgi:hypothetical protein